MFPHPGSWNSVDLAKGDFTGMTWDNVIQMKFDGQFNGDGSANTAPWTVYLDNIYFYNDGSGDNGGGGDPGDGGDDGTPWSTSRSMMPLRWTAGRLQRCDPSQLGLERSGRRDRASRFRDEHRDGAGRAAFSNTLTAMWTMKDQRMTLSFDKAGSPLVGTAVHLQTEFPGAGTINTFDIQNSGINESGWTTLSYDFSGVSGDGIFRMQFNMAAGAFSGAGGTLLVDNISLTGSGSGGGGGPVEPRPFRLHSM